MMTSTVGGSLEVPPMGEWNAEEGVWVGERVPFTHTLSDLPRPLYIFGYGSLIWRPGPLLEHCPTFKGTAVGYKRMFAQRSCDHRGTRDFPGVVLNLVRHDLLQTLGYYNYYDDDHCQSPSETSDEEDCHGLLFRIPEARLAEVVEDLDYRERGGYHRHCLPVRVQVDTPDGHRRGDLVQAIVYTAHECNPLFVKPTDPLRLQRRAPVTDLIASSIGPSGPNVDYLFRLQQYLQERGMDDVYINTLTTAVRMRLGCWRSRLHRLDWTQEVADWSSSSAVTNLTATMTAKTTLSAAALRTSSSLLGWGSNELSQLHPKSTRIRSTEEMTSRNAPLDEPIEWSPMPLTGLPLPTLLTSPRLDWSTAEQWQVVCGGSSSSVLWTEKANHSNSNRDNKSDRHLMLLWGDRMVEHFLQCVPEEYRSGCQQKGRPQAVMVDGIVGVALGYDHALMVTVSNQILSIGNNSHLQCAVPAALQASNAYFQYQLPPADSDGSILSFTVHTSNNNNESVGSLSESEETVLKVAVGLRHSAAITKRGRLFTWGESRHGQAFGDPNHHWTTIHGRNLIDVSCGAKHTVVIDEHGVVYSMGSNYYGSLGREIYAEINDVLTHYQRTPPTRHSALVDQDMRVVMLPTHLKAQKV
jgi:glutathione-specific gamma-glutamylcyclotransferase